MAIKSYCHFLPQKYHTGMPKLAINTSQKSQASNWNYASN